MTEEGIKTSVKVTVSDAPKKNNQEVEKDEPEE